ncbi:hypothetical protein M3Y99_00380600 [Aphelenchoides fujianensis]|nr:hypothetical protein M3Y99_00380600 [Aphelenchoides fujianensis]
MAEQSAIVQFPCAQVCGCPKCWKTADRPVRCTAHSEKKVVKPATPWSPSNHSAEDFVVVDSFTFVVLERYWNHLALYLIRLTATSDAYECRLLHRFPEGLTTVCLRLKLANGDVQHVILGMWLAITFVRLDVAEAALEVDHTTELPFGDLISFAWSNDGRHLFSMQQWTERALHVYSVEEKKWTKEPQADGGFAFELSRAPISCFSRTIYAHAHAPVPDGETTISPLFRFNLEQRKWEQVAAEVEMNSAASSWGPVASRLLTAQQKAEVAAVRERVLRKAADGEPFCTECGVECPNDEELGAHLAAHQQAGLPAACAICGLCFNDWKQRISHEHAFACSCGFKFSKLHHRLLHERKHKKGLKFKCSACEWLVETAELRNEHENRIHGIERHPDTRRSEEAVKIPKRRLSHLKEAERRPPLCCL